MDNQNVNIRTQVNRVEDPNQLTPWHHLHLNEGREWVIRFFEKNLHQMDTSMQRKRVTPGKSR